MKGELRGTLSPYPGLDPSLYTDRPRSDHYGQGERGMANVDPHICHLIDKVKALNVGVRR